MAATKTPTVSDYVDFLRFSQGLHDLTSGLATVRKLIGDDKALCAKVWRIYVDGQSDYARMILDNTPYKDNALLAF